MADVTRFKVGYHDSPRAGRLALVTMDNGRDHTRPNTFGAESLVSLDAALDELAAQPDVKGLLLTGKPFVFAVGADLDAFGGATEEFARAAAARGHRAFRRLADLPFPTLAAINGACMGGGLEIALHCDVRTLSTAAAGIAFPEVFLSIVPAWGGTQLAPRVVGAANALQAIVANALDNNRVMKPAQAFHMGFADRLIDAVDFLDDSVALLKRLCTGEERIERPAVHDAGDLDEALATARRAADDRVHGATRAPYVAIDLIEFAARGGAVDEGCRREEDALADLLPARQAQAAVYSFGLTQHRVKRQPWKPAMPPRAVGKVGIVGSGLMGAQLGALFLQRLEVPVVLTDVDEAVLERARGLVEGELDKRVQRGRESAGKAEFLKSLVTYTVSREPLAGSGLVLEAVVEVLDVKRRVFADVERVVDAGCLLATNTSSLSVEAMGEGLAHPERMVGLHFFNPVALMPLVEVVRTPASSQEALATAFAVAKRLRKSAVPVADAPAFVVNRLWTRFTGACGEAVNAGNDFAEVDDAVKALGLPMGPFELLGLVGLKVAANVARTLHEAYPERFPLDANFQMLGETDLPGVYDWARGRVPFEEVTRRWRVTDGARPLTGEQIRTRALEAVADEIRHMLDERVVADARDIDTCMLLGAGWPFFMGGICKHLDQTGISEKLFGAPLVGELDAAFAQVSGVQG